MDAPRTICCSEAAACAGSGQPCGFGCCSELECAPNGTCTVPAPPICAPGTNACTSCIRSACCSQVVKCQSTPECSKAFDCLEQCVIAGEDTSTCLNQCGTVADWLEPIALCLYAACVGSC